MNMCLPKYHQVYEDERSVYLVMELMRGGELVDRIIGLKIFSEREAAAVLYTLVGAMQYLHQNGVCIDLTSKC